MWGWLFITEISPLMLMIMFTFVLLMLLAGSMIDYLYQANIFIHSIVNC